MLHATQPITPTVSAVGVLPVSRSNRNSNQEMLRMQDVWFVAALWLALALIATMLSIWFRIATALSEIVVGTVAQLIIGALIGTQVLRGSAEWITFLAGTGSIVLTFLAGAGRDPQ